MQVSQGIPSVTTFNCSVVCYIQGVLRYLEIIRAACVTKIPTSRNVAFQRF